MCSISAQVAARDGDDVIIVEADGNALTASGCREAVGRRAAALARRGVGAGDRVATLQGLGADALLTWWAVDLLGAVYVPLNPLMPPRLASRVLHDRAPAVLVADDGLRDLAEAGAGTVPVIAAAALDVQGTSPDGVTRDDLGDCAIVHNSGLPGIHHGVRTSARMLATMAGGMAGTLFPGARVLVAAPTCFTGTLLTIYGAVAGGGSVALLPGLTPETFWPSIRRSGVSSAAMMNPTVADMLARPPSSTDRQHPLRAVGAPPGQYELNAQAVERFGIAWFAGLGKTEVCGAVVTGPNPGPDEGVGRVRPPYTGQVVDADGEPVGADEPGELVLRCDTPGGLPAGYADDGEATRNLWRGGWMHTGWHVRQDGAGQVHTVGNASIHPIVVKRAGYLFVADLEAEITALGTGVTGVRVQTRPGPGALAEPLVTAFVEGEGVDPAVLRAELASGLPAHLVPDDIVTHPAS